MTIRLAVDAKRLAIVYLRGHESVLALTGSAAKVSDRAKGPFPEVTVTDFGGNEVVAPGGLVAHLDEVYLQVDCWGASHEDQGATRLLARTVRAALMEMPSVAHADGVVTRVRTITPPMDVADEPLDRSRVRQELGVFVHPLKL